LHRGWLAHRLADRRAALGGADRPPRRRGLRARDGLAPPPTAARVGVGGGCRRTGWLLDPQGPTLEATQGTRGSRREQQSCKSVWNSYSAFSQEACRLSRAVSGPFLPVMLMHLFLNV